MKREGNRSILAVDRPGPRAGRYGRSETPGVIPLPRPFRIVSTCRLAPLWSSIVAQDICTRSLYAWFNVPLRPPASSRPHSTNTVGCEPGGGSQRSNQPAVSESDRCHPQLHPRSHQCCSSLGELRSSTEWTEETRSNTLALQVAWCRQFRCGEVEPGVLLVDRDIRLSLLYSGKPGKTKTIPG